MNMLAISALSRTKVMSKMSITLFLRCGPCEKLGMIQGGACQTKRANVVSPQAYTSHLETNPEGAREEPC